MHFGQQFWATGNSANMDDVTINEAIKLSSSVL